MSYWHLRGKDRAAAKAAYEAEHPERPEVKSGPTLEREEDDIPGFMGLSGNWWPIGTTPRRIVQLAASSGLRPSQRVSIVIDGRCLLGKSGRKYALFLENVNLFRASYRSAVQLEKQLEKQLEN